MTTRPLLSKKRDLRSWMLYILAPYALATILLLSASCSGEAPTNLSLKLKVMTTNGILADLTKEVGEGRLEVVSLVPPGADLHSFRPNPTNMKAISNADIIIYNGLGLDDALLSVILNTVSPSTVLIMASEGLRVEPLDFESQGEHPHKSYVAGLKKNPHLWQNPMYAIHYVHQISEGLSLANPMESDQYKASAEAYIERLRRLDKEIADTLSVVPPERRLLVTFHDAFGHFAYRYGWDSSALLTHEDGDITPKAITSIMETVTSKGITTIFMEPQFNSSILDQLSNDTTVAIGIIYSDTLDNTTSTYIDMMRFNANSIATHLGNSGSNNQ